MIESIWVFAGSFMAKATNISFSLANRAIIELNLPHNSLADILPGNVLFLVPIAVLCCLLHLDNNPHMNRSHP
jgi:hypothetical protein